MVSLFPLASNASRQLHVLGHDGDALCVKGAQVGVLKQTNKVCFGSLLKCKDGSTLETQIISTLRHVNSNLADQTLERSLACESKGPSTFGACGFLLALNKRNETTNCVSYSQAI